jgi:sigma-B regulation protein RsbU (phosphoserine phosphatase)
MKNRGLAFKLVVLILSGAGAVFLAAFAYSYQYSKMSVMSNVDKNTGNLAHSTVHQIETVLTGGVEKPAKNFAALLTADPPAGAGIIRYAECMVQVNSEIFASSISFEPNAMDPRSHYFSDYCYRKADGGLACTRRGGASYDYFTMDWYQIPKELDRAEWSEPFYDEGGGNIIMATYSVPFYRKTTGGAKFLGVVTADISLLWLKNIVSSLHVYGSGYAFLISRNGTFISHPNSGLIMRHTIFSIAETNEDPRLRRIGQDMIHGGEGLAAIGGDVLSRSRAWMYYAPLPSMGWSLGIVIPEEELFSDIYRLGRQVVSIGLGGLLLMSVLIVVTANRITKPLRSLALSTMEVARGDLDTEVPPIRTEDEIGKLARSFGIMKVALKEYIANLTATTAAKERYESELKIAKRIQMSFLPREFPPIAEKGNFELFAKLQAAREIGGDFYDFSLLDDHHLFFAVGDVSDKGIPAALFMAVVKTLMKGIAEAGMEPSEILRRINMELCRENDSMMFVTVFCAVLDLETGLMRYSNAGHEPPVIIGGDGGPEWLPIPKGFVAGGMEESTYETMEMKLQAGDTLLAYTDGVTEAMNVDNELYSNTRLMEVVRSSSSRSAEKLAMEVMESVHGFSSGAPQSDDITVLALTFRPSGGPPEAP